jgi:hypothetical protein
MIGKVLVKNIQVKNFDLSSTGALDIIPMIHQHRNKSGSESGMEKTRKTKAYKNISTEMSS